MSDGEDAPGRPGLPPRWTSSRKTGVGTARNRESRVWFTLCDGILTEVYYPRIDHAAIRDMGLIVTDGGSFFSEEKLGARATTKWMGDGVPGFRVKNVCKDGRYTIEKTIVADPHRHTVLQQTTFTPAAGSVLRLHVLLAPRLGNQGHSNSACVSSYKGIPMLVAEGGGYALAIACTNPWVKRSAGYVGVSDGWQDLRAHGHMEWEYAQAMEGNVALTGEIDVSAQREFVLALGFGRTSNEAAHRVRASFEEGFEATCERFTREWTAWQKTLNTFASGSHNGSAYRVSTAVLALHESKDFPGGTIASLSFPWGEIQDDTDEGGYHLVWPRDAYETASALLAAGAGDEVVRALNYFAVTQEADGHWPQNMWLDGFEFFHGIQLDETAAPLLLLDLAHRHGKVGPADMARLWPTMRRAAGYIVREGPSTPQDRWEEDAGLTPFTIACEIAGLLVAADMADAQNERGLAEYFRDTADAWNSAIEEWLYARGTDLARENGVDGYYVRIVPPARLSGDGPLSQYSVTIPNHATDTTFPSDQIVSADALALVRFGLRAADDPRIVNTVRVIDRVLKVETANGPCWYRYNHDGYGEHADGAPYDGAGVGRLWPLLVGERAHYELAQGNHDEARRLLAVMENQSGDSGLFSEQIWDTKPIPERNLENGRPTGSARPLVWAHAEHVKLLRSIGDDAIFDRPAQTVARYVEGHTDARWTSWRFEAQTQRIKRGRGLRIEARARCRVHWSVDAWATAQETEARDSTIGLFVVDVPAEKLSRGDIVFTFYWIDALRWEGANFTVTVAAG